MAVRSRSGVEVLTETPQWARGHVERIGVDRTTYTGWFGIVTNTSGQRGVGFSSRHRDNLVFICQFSEVLAIVLVDNTTS